MTDIPILMCARVVEHKLLLDDNETGNCAECGHLVQFRPHAPPVRILRCMQCATELLEPGDTISVPLMVLSDLRAFFRRTKQ